MSASLTSQAYGSHIQAEYFNRLFKLTLRFPVPIYWITASDILIILLLFFWMFGGYQWLSLRYHPMTSSEFWLLKICNHALCVTEIIKCTQKTVFVLKALTETCFGQWRVVRKKITAFNVKLSKSIFSFSGLSCDRRVSPSSVCNFTKKKNKKWILCF